MYDTLAFGMKQLKYKVYKPDLHFTNEGLIFNKFQSHHIKYRPVALFKIVSYQELVVVEKKANMNFGIHFCLSAFS